MCWDGSVCLALMGVKLVRCSNVFAGMIAPDVLPGGPTLKMRNHCLALSVFGVRNFSGLV